MEVIHVTNDGTPNIRMGKINPANDVFLYCNRALEQLGPKDTKQRREVERIRSFCTGLLAARVERKGSRSH